MAKATLVELIEAYERTLSDTIARQSQEPKTWPGWGPVYELEDAIQRRLEDEKDPVVTWKGNIYWVCPESGKFEVFRDVRTAYEIDRVANEAAGVTVSDDDGEVD